MNIILMTKLKLKERWCLFKVSNHIIAMNFPRGMEQPIANWFQWKSFVFFRLSTKDFLSLWYACGCGSAMHVHSIMNLLIKHIQSIADTTLNMSYNIYLLPPYRYSVSLQSELSHYYTSSWLAAVLSEAIWFG